MSVLRATLRGIPRLLALRPCEFCGKRVECWRWHVEYLTCGVTYNQDDQPIMGNLSTATHTLDGDSA